MAVVPRTHELARRRKLELQQLSGLERCPGEEGGRLRGRVNGAGAPRRGGAGSAWTVLESRFMRVHCFRVAILLVGLGGLACGDDEPEGTEADRLGVGAACASDSQCYQEHGDGGIHQTCLTQFKGGYCGIEDCVSDEDCPERSACIAHTDQRNYCFRVCADKPECNVNRPADAESNCSANVDFVDGSRGKKACVPPSG